MITKMIYLLIIIYYKKLYLWKLQTYIFWNMKTTFNPKFKCFRNTCLYSWHLFVGLFCLLWTLWFSFFIILILSMWIWVREDIMFSCVYIFNVSLSFLEIPASSFQTSLYKVEHGQGKHLTRLQYTTY